jgi:anti-sigma regulatory factor (Ser/Thr protein kinase)
MSKAAVEESKLSVRRMGVRMELKMTSHPSILRPARLALEEFGRQAGLPGEQADDLGLVLNEALANVIRHAYGGATDKPIVVTFDRRVEGDKEEIVVEIRDWAKPVDPAKLPDTKPIAPGADLDVIKPGGLGLICMRKHMDAVHFAPQADGTLLTMIKKVAPAKSEGERKSK